MGFNVNITKVSVSVGFSMVSGDEAIGQSIETQVLTYSTREVAEEAKTYIEKNYSYQVEIEETSAAGWSEFKPSVFDYYQQRAKQDQSRRYNRQSRAYSRRNRY